MAMKNWLGAAIGAFIGGARGSLLGALAGAVLGNWIQGKIESAFKPSDAGQDETRTRELAVLTALSAMLAKLAKADGRITADEIRFCEDLFARLGLSGGKRDYCVEAFRRAKSDAHTIYEYADSFAAAQPDVSVRGVVYDILWGMADADGTVSENELAILERIAAHLRLDRSNYTWQCRRRGIDAQRRTDDGTSDAQREEDPFAVLGCTRTATDEELRAAYRERAKHLHPDMLRAQGLSEELVSRANEQMARLNAAWSEIRRIRGCR